MKVMDEKLKYKQILADFLDEYETEMIIEWSRKIKVQETDPYKDKIREDGQKMYAAIINCIKREFSENDMKQMAQNVAKEQLEANVNIGDLLYNINFGRQIMLKWIFTVDFTTDQLLVVIEEINHYFDCFSYYAVTIYTNYKNDMLEEKSLLINKDRKDKMALLGQISSSFVHEFRNPLTAVIGFNKLLKNENPTMKYLDIIDYELNQLNFRITQFLHTSKVKFGEEKRVAIHINELIDEIQRLCFASLVDSNIEIEVDVSPNLIVIVGRDGLKQVLLNLFLNSIDALVGRENKRKIIVNAYVEHKNLIFKITNNGPVIEKEYLETIFEPFFTTKELGVGIGLYVCKKIIESSGGYMVCESTNDRTTFSIIFPENCFCESSVIK